MFIVGGYSLLLTIMTFYLSVEKQLQLLHMAVLVYSTSVVSEDKI